MSLRLNRLNRSHRGRVAAALTAVLTVTSMAQGASAAGLGSSATAPPAEVAAVPSASSSVSGVGAALADGDVARGRLGSEWQATPNDPAPWAQLTWPSAQSIASVQVFGSSAHAFDPKQSTAAALYGTLRFSDGSTVAVSGVAPGGGMPTTVAFTPRPTSWVRFEIKRQIASAPVALRELTAYRAGVTPPVWAPLSAARFATAPEAASCTGVTAAASAKDGRLGLSCPAPGSSVSDNATLVLTGPAGARLTVWTAVQGARASWAPLRRAADAVVDASGGTTGRAHVTADVRSLPQGPFALKVTGTDGAGTALKPLYVQLFRAGGSVAPAGTGDGAPAGMTLQYDEQFDGPLSVTVDGGGAQYAAVKPEPWGGSQFGESVFADPAWGAGTLATLPGGYLRIRNQPIGQFASRQTWGQQHISGILSSQRFGGSGFSAQYGYFEARILGAPGPGAWPAFWMMNSASGVGRASTAKAEVDAVELYGHATRNACHATHAWAAPKGSDGLLSCKDLADSGDWAAQWHTYGVQVRSGGADFFVDGVEVASLDQLSNTEEPFFFMLDLATGGGWPVDLSGTQGTTDMYVDWVRVYT